MLNFPKLNRLPVKELCFSQFSGTDAGLGAEENSIFEAFNISARDFPKLKTREGRRFVNSVPTGEPVKGMFAFDKSYIVTAFKTITQIYTGSTPADLELFYSTDQYNLSYPTICKFGDRVCLFNVKSANDSDYEAVMILESNGLDVKRVSLPCFEDVMVHNNRILGCQRNRIYACAAGDAFNWDPNEQREDTRNRAVVKTYNTSVDFVCCISYRNMALFFTSDETYRLKGTDSDDFEIEKLADVGCINKKAICECGGELYFMSRKGLVRFNLGKVKIVDRALNRDYRALTDVVICPTDDMVYLNLDFGGDKEFYAYSTQTGGIATYQGFDSFIAKNLFGRPYFASEEKIYEFDVPFSAEDEGEDIYWHIETQNIKKFLPNRTVGTKLEMRIYVDPGALAEVWIDTDNKGYQVIYTILEGQKDVCIPIPDTDFKSIRIKILGRGNCEIESFKLKCHQDSRAGEQNGR